MLKYPACYVIPSSFSLSWTAPGSHQNPTVISIFPSGGLNDMETFRKWSVTSLLLLVTSWARTSIQPHNYPLLRKSPEDPVLFMWSSRSTLISSSRSISVSTLMRGSLLKISIVLSSLAVLICVMSFISKTNGSSGMQDNYIHTRSAFGTYFINVTNTHRKQLGRELSKVHTSLETVSGALHYRFGKIVNDLSWYQAILILNALPRDFEICNLVLFLAKAAGTFNTLWPVKLALSVTGCASNSYSRCSKVIQLPPSDSQTMSRDMWLRWRVAQIHILT